MQTSPLPMVIEHEVDFFKALREVAEGSRIARASWEEGYWVQMYSEQLVIRKPDGVFYPLIVSDGDMMAEDWVVLPSGPRRNGTGDAH